LSPQDGTNVSIAAQFVHELSSFEGIFDSGATLAVLKIKTIKQYIDEYFAVFARSGYHIIHSTPVFEGTTETRITSTTFHVVSKTTVTIKNAIHKHESPVIVVCGMTRNQPLPTAAVKWSPSLAFQSGNLVCVSYDSFLKSLLARLALVNARTTIVPRYPTELEDEWNVYLTTWDQHIYRRNRDCVFKLIQGSESSSALEYQWNHLDVWSHERHGSLETHGKYDLDCKYSRILHEP
jgi:hypothetical protein